MIVASRSYDAVTELVGSWTGDQELQAIVDAIDARPSKKAYELASAEQEPAVSTEAPALLVPDASDGDNQPEISIPPLSIDSGVSAAMM